MAQRRPGLFSLILPRKPVGGDAIRPKPLTFARIWIACLPLSIACVSASILLSDGDPQRRPFVVFGIGVAFGCDRAPQSVRRIDPGRQHRTGQTARARCRTTWRRALGVNHDVYDDAYIRQILTEVRRIAIVGASANEVRPSFFVTKYLIAKGYEVFPVNPGVAGKAIAGRMTFATLGDVPPPVDMVDIFRAADAVPAIVEDAIQIGAKVVWMQLGVRHDEAAARAEAAGLKVVMNRCPKIEYGRLCGEIGWQA